jgi:CheY-like chemotaxis protein
MRRSQERETLVEEQPLHILMVDDDEFFSGVVCKQLRAEYKFQVTAAENGLQARQLIEKEPAQYDVIFTDYDMPEMGGLDLLQWILDNQIEIPVVMLTAAGSEQVAVEAMKLGAYDYVRKEHLDLQHLGIIIHATNERRQLRIIRAREEERTKELQLNDLATDKVRDVLNALTPVMNAAIAGIMSEVELDGEELCLRLPEPYCIELKKILSRIRTDTKSVETSTRGLLGLYKLLYAHHAGMEEIDRLKTEIENQSALN